MAHSSSTHFLSSSWLSGLTTWLFGLVEVGLGFRFVLKLLGANAQAPFVGWVYDTTLPLLRPFQFAFPTSSVTGGFVLEFSTLFAIFTYAFVGYLVQELLEMIEGRGKH